MRENGGNRLVPGPDYMVDALKFSNQAPRVSGESLQMFVAWRCPDGTQHIFCWPILAISDEKRERVFNVWPEVYFSGFENVTEFSEGIDNQIKLLEIPSDLSCDCLKSHLLGRALDWYQIFGSAIVQITATNFAQLKAALSKAFPAIQNRKDLETRFYASQQRQNQEPTDFVYDLLKLQKKKKLELGMSEKALVDHILVRHEPQVQDYVEVRNPQNTIQLLEVLAKLEERYSGKEIRGSRNSDNVEGRGWNGVGCLMLVIIEEIGEILKWCVERIMVEMIIEVTMRIAVKEISGSRAGIGFKTMIEDLR
ncbi:uncharacterized protein TNCV_3095891 [Trichonephila clavipes]|nr:uncharacterized protein TNCV_3095891 [Trichonephila clavipes]